ncbi:MAG TPA: hypothetical protein VF883_00810 [Thermoanaerobaculia bacterium]
MTAAVLPSTPTRRLAALGDAAPTLTTSTELMRNYKPVSIMTPDASFEAVQTTAGTALLFSIGTDGAFYVTAEAPGATSGWQRTSLSASLGATVKTFAVAENAATGTIDLALVMTEGQADVLYLSLGNSASDTSWLASVAWTAVPYDDAARPLARVVVADLFINNTADGESIVADVLRDPSSAAPVIFRYFIDPTKRLSGQAWNPHDVAGDLDASTISSCLGRRPGDYVEGIYTGGSIGGHPQLFFQPLYNAFRPGVPAPPARFVLPGGETSAALVALSTGTGTTDLFVAAGQTIYYFAADAQGDGATGVALLNNALFDGVRKLFGYGDANQVILWGLDRANQVFYVRCQRAQVTNPGAWSVPLPICQGAEQLSPYVNRVNDGNTFFVQTGASEVQRATQAPGLTTWRYEHILLPAPANTTSMKASSYTTRIQVTDATNRPLAKVTVQLSAQHRAGVYVNGLYTVLDTDPIGIPTDSLGSITVIEWIESVRGTPLTATIAGAVPATINPMAKPFAKAASLTGTDSLRGAQITAPDGTTRPLVSSDVSDDDLKVAAAVFANLQSVYQSLPPDGSAATHTASLRSFEAGRVTSFAVSPGGPLRAASLASFDNIIEVAAGDLLSWLEGAADYVVHLAEDTASGLWHFIAEIGGQVYSFVLDAVAKVVGALEAVYRAIKTAIEDLIAFLEFLFEWKSFVRTKDVCKKVLMLSLGRVLDEVGTIQSDLDAIMQSARTGVDDWAGLASNNWQDGVPDSSEGLGALRSGGDIVDLLTAPAMFFYNHVMDNLGGARLTPAPTTGNGSSALDRASSALSNSSDLALVAIDRIKAELIDGSVFGSASLGDILKKLAAIVVDAFLNGTQTLIDALLEALVIVARDGVAALDTPIWIPVLSDILEDFGVTINFSLLDVFMMIGAIPATLAYKLATGDAPLGDSLGDKILGANTFDELVAAFQHAGTMEVAEIRSTATAMTQGWPVIGLTPKDERELFIIGHSVAAVGALLSTVAVAAPDDDGYTYFLAAASGVTGISLAMASLFESPLPIQNAAMYRMAKATSSLGILNKVLAIGWRSRALVGPGPTPAEIEQAGVVSAGVDATLAFLSLTPSVYHFQELADAPSGSPRSSAIVNETANIVNDFNRIVMFFVKTTSDSQAKAALVMAASALMLMYGGLQVAEAAISPT